MPIIGLSSSPRTLRTFRPGAYFTDGTDLYRVVTTLVDPWLGSESAELEDCRSLETAVYAQGVLDSMGLRPVRLDDSGAAGAS